MFTNLAQDTSLLISQQNTQSQMLLLVLNTFSATLDVQHTVILTLNLSVLLLWNVFTGYQFHWLDVFLEESVTLLQSLLFT